MSDAPVRRLREQIAEWDRAVLDAVNARLRLVAELKRHKEGEGIDFVDAGQEERLLQALEQANGGPPLTMSSAAPGTRCRIAGNALISASWPLRGTSRETHTTRGRSASMP